MFSEKINDFFAVVNSKMGQNENQLNGFWATTRISKMKYSNESYTH